MLFLEATSSMLSPEVVSALVVLLMVLISCISAKRFNFLHGFIVFFTLLSLLFGISELLTRYLPDNGIAANIVKNLTVVNAIGSPLLGGLVNFIKTLPFVSNNSNEMLQDVIIYGTYFLPVVVWFISRTFAGMFRRNRKRY